MSEKNQLPDFEDTVAKVDFLLCAITDMLRHAEDGAPSGQVVLGAMNVACDLVRDLERILEAHPGLP